jgi:hypothetical protein
MKFAKKKKNDRREIRRTYSPQHELLMVIAKSMFEPQFLPTTHTRRI